MTFMESLNKLFPNGSAIRGRPSQMISCLLEKRWLLHEIPSGKLTEGTSPFQLPALLTDPQVLQFFCCGIACQLEVVHLSQKVCTSVRSCAGQLEVAHVSQKLCPSVRSVSQKLCSSVRSVSQKLCTSVGSCARRSCARQLEVVPVSQKLCTSVRSCARQFRSCARKIV